MKEKGLHVDGSEHELAERFVAESPIGDRLTDEIFEHHLASGALRLIEINGQPQKLDRPGNKEVKARLTLESGYFGIINQNSDFIKAEIDDLVIKDEEVPESYYHWRLQFELNTTGRLKFVYGSKAKNELRIRLNETLREDQKASLVEWSDYLRSDEHGCAYPDWFKVYVWESLKDMGEFEFDLDEKKGAFKKRTRSTTMLWPELSTEALAYVYDIINKGIIQDDITENDSLSQLIKNGDFAELYAHALFVVDINAIVSYLDPRDIAYNLEKFCAVEGIDINALVSRLGSFYVSLMPNKLLAAGASKESLEEKLGRHL